QPCLTKRGIESIPMLEEPIGIRGIWVNSYNMGRPTGRDIQNALSRVFGEKEGAEFFDQACHLASIDKRSIHSLNLDQLLTIAKKLEMAGGLAAVVACSISVKINTFKSIEKAGQQ
ncbi:MAG: hypothetical protein P1V97_30270, partial [Planctomycetota bacterium]|nr:hypothetical protein [Planctomycetota bacterium]